MSIPSRDFNTLNIESPKGIIIMQEEPSIKAMTERAMQDLDGGTFEDGHRMARAIIRKSKAGLVLRNILLESEYGFEGSMSIVRARITPLNLGLAVGFGMAENEEQAVEIVPLVNSLQSNMPLGQTGLYANYEPVTSYDDMTEQEQDSFKRSAGFAVMPRLPLLRAELV